MPETAGLEPIHDSLRGGRSPQPEDDGPLAMRSEERGAWVRLGIGCAILGIVVAVLVYTRDESTGRIKTEVPANADLSAGQATATRSLTEVAEASEVQQAHIAEEVRKAEEALARLRSEAVAKHAEEAVVTAEGTSRMQGAPRETSLAREARAEPTPTEEVARVGEAEREQIRGLLDHAEADLGAQRLTSPPGRNAFEKYQQVLALEPDNAAAADGLTRVVDGYLELVEKALKKGKPDLARDFLDRAEQVLPGSERIALARRALDGDVPPADAATSSN